MAIKTAKRLRFRGRFAVFALGRPIAGGLYIIVVSSALNNNEYNTFLLPQKAHFFIYNQIINRKFPPLFIRQNLTKCKLAAGRLAGIFLLFIPLGYRPGDPGSFAED